MAILRVPPSGHLEVVGIGAAPNTRREMTGILDHIERAQVHLERAVKDLQADEQVGLTADLLRALLALEEQYKEHTLDLDREHGERPGTAYHEGGNCIEFYIESDAWHEISVALRKWMADNPDWSHKLNMNAEEVDCLIDMPNPRK